MNRLIKYILTTLLAGSLLPLQSQLLLNHRVSFDMETFQLIDSGEGLSRIVTDGRDYFYKTEVGKPALPYKAIKILVPNGADFVDYKISLERNIFKEDVKLVPNSIHWPVSVPPDFSKADPAGASINNSFPDKVLEYTSTQIMGGFTYFCFTVSPFFYESDQLVLYLIKNLDLKLFYRVKQGQSLPVYGDEALERSVKELVDNPEDLDMLYPRYKSIQKSESTGPEYLIVTTGELKDSFKPLLDWKRRKGLKAGIITLEEIYSTYSEEQTDQLKIKRCLSDLYEQGNLKWVLLGGDHDIVPVQLCYGKVNLGKETLEDNSIPTDLFYACFDLSFNWNSLDDNKVGEPHMDYVDIVPEIFLSRIPVRNKDQVKTFVQKTLKYEQDPPREDFMEKMLLSGVKSWNIWDNKSDSHHRNEKMYRKYIELNWSGKRFGFYDTGGTFPEGDKFEVSATNLSDQINGGYGIFHFAGHGNTNSYLMETGSNFNTDDAAELSHEGYGLMLSTTCDVNSFDSEYQCLSESFLFNPGGGCVAFFGSSRLGLGVPDTSFNLGPSFQFNAKFMEHLFNTGTKGSSNSFAAISSAAKASMSGFDAGGSYWYLQYALNPMGDPELPIYTQNPREFEDVKIYRWGTQLTVNTGGVEDCRICLTGAGIETGYQVNADGVSSHTFSDIPDDFQIVITRPNYVPYQYSNGVSTNMTADLSAAIQIYPNPVSEILVLGIDFHKGSFILYDMNGRSLKEGSLAYGENKIPVFEHPSGAYILKVQHLTGVACYKLLIQ